MGYYVRVFCTEDKRPKLKEVLDHINGLGFDYKAEADLDEESLNSNEWTNFHMRYNEEKQPIVVELNHVKDEDGLASEEIKEFLEEIAEQEDEDSLKVIGHLRNTKYVIACQLLSDVDDDGYNANGEFLNYFVDHFGGMIHADDEGFYKGNEIILETD